MAQMTSTDMSLVDAVFGMHSGYVLDFTNSSFSAFFTRDLEVDIYHDRYARHGNSKAKRLRAFLEIEPNVEAARALAALWEYRISKMLNSSDPEFVPGARRRMSEVVVKLGGQPLLSEAPTDKVGEAAHRVKMPTELELAALESEFLTLTGMDDTPNQRGYAFEKFLKKWFDTWHLEAHTPFRVRGEQIDGSFQHDGQTYIIEAKWQTPPVDAAKLHSFQGKLLERPDWSRGFYIAYGGFSNDSFEAFTARRVTMMIGADIYHALNRRLNLGEVIRRKVRHHTERKEPLALVTDLFTV